MTLKENALVNDSNMEVEVLKVSSKSNPSAVGGAIATILRKGKKAELQAIGAGAVNQAVKAIAIARGYVAPLGMDLRAVFEFTEVEINGETKTAIKMSVLGEQGGESMEILKVSSKSKPNAVAGALASVLKQHKKAELQAIGAGAVNQAVKAIAIARGYVAPLGMDLICVPAFTEVNINGEERTAIRFIVKALE